MRGTMALISGAEKGQLSLPHDDSLKQRLDGFHQFIRPGSRGIAMDDLAVTVNQKFGEIPFDGLGAEYAGCFMLEPDIERMRIVTIDINLGEEREADIEARLAELADGLCVARLLSAELIAGEAENNQALSW